MCICCCPNRKSLLIYAIVVTGVTFIFGIITVALFGSNSDVHEYLVIMIDYQEETKGISSIGIDFPNNQISFDPEDFSMDSQDAKSMLAISALTYQFLQNKEYGVIKSLKGIDDSFGVILFIISILLLAHQELSVEYFILFLVSGFILLYMSSSEKSVNYL